MTRPILEPSRDSIDLLIVASDIKRTLDFYQRILGLEKVGEVETPFGTSHRLRYGTSLIKIMDPKQPPPPSLFGLDKQLGFRCMSFPIRDLDHACAALERESVQFAVAPRQALPNTRLALIKDPDGNLVELIEAR